MGECAVQHGGAEHGDAQHGHTKVSQWPSSIKLGHRDMYLRLRWDALIDERGASPRLG